MKKKVLLVIIWMIIIFMFSCNNGDVSSSQSDIIVNIIINIFGILPNITFFVRKCAHFTEYFILGLLVYNMIRCAEFRLRNMALIAILICFIYAGSDEIHQLFVPGRSSQIRDVLIDTIGSTCGIVTYKLLKERRKSVRQWR